jgi:hypothetical protein
MPSQQRSTSVAWSIALFRVAASISRRLRDMDAAGVDVHVLSATPQTYLYTQEPELAATVAAIQNDQMAKLVKQIPSVSWALRRCRCRRPKWLPTS